MKLTHLSVIIHNFNRAESIETIKKLFNIRTFKVYTTCLKTLIVVNPHFPDVTPFRFKDCSTFIQLNGPIAEQEKILHNTGFF